MLMGFNEIVPQDKFCFSSPSVEFLSDERAILRTGQNTIRGRLKYNLNTALPLVRCTKSGYCVALFIIQVGHG